MLTLKSKYCTLKIIIITDYTYVGTSVKFGYLTSSIFFIVAKYSPLTKVIYENLSKNTSIKVRFGDQIRISEGVLAYHLENGIAWKAKDAITFCSLDDSDRNNLPIGKKRVGIRFNSARSDASIGAIKNKIEKTFGLPEGSVALCAQIKKLYVQMLKLQPYVSDGGVNYV